MNDMKSSEIKRFKRYLEIHREEALRSLTHLEDETRSLDSGYPQDVADVCISGLSKESLFQRASERRRFLQIIEAALARVQQGTYGVCACCGDEIHVRRLEAVPWSRYCLKCQTASERGTEVDLLDASGQHVMPRKAG
jgi:DnaK suppressor protein